MFLKDKNQDVIFLFFEKPFYVPLRNDYVATNELQVVIFSALRLNSTFQGLTQNLEKYYIVRKRIFKKLKHRNPIFPTTR